MKPSMHSSTSSASEQQDHSREQEYLLRKLKVLLAARIRDGRRGWGCVPDVSIVQENRRMIRDCIIKIRQLRAAGGSSPWLGLGQREAPRAR